MARITEPIEAFTYIKRQQGWRTALNQAGQFLREPFFEYHQGYVLRKSLQEPIEIPPPEVAVTVRQLLLKDLDILETIMPPLRIRRLSQKLSDGELCSVAIKDQEAVAFVLAGFRNTPSTRAARLMLGPKEAYLWSGYALPEFRRQGVVRAVNLHLCRLLQEKGYECALLLVEKQNRASLGHCFKMGYVITEQITYFRISRWGRTQLVPIQESHYLPVKENK